MLKIKEFSQTTGFSIRMLRYLEECDLLIPERGENNYRFYQKEQIEFANWISEMQELGLKLREIKDFHENAAKQLAIINDVLKRQKDEYLSKSRIIPMLEMIKKELEENGNYSLENTSRKITSLAGEDKFQRTAYSLPALRNVYEKGLVSNAEIDLISTNFFKFESWMELCDYKPQVFSFLEESAFALGKNLTADFVSAYEKSWKEYLSPINFESKRGFSKADITQLYGPHDIIICSEFRYLDTAELGEIIIPYTPVYALSKTI